MNKVKNSSEKIAKRKYAENTSVNEANINEKIAVRQTVIKTDNLNKYLNQIKHENSLISETNGLKNSKSSKNSNSAAVSKSELAANYLKNQGLNGTTYQPKNEFKAVKFGDNSFSSLNYYVPNKKIVLNNDFDNKSKQNDFSTKKQKKCRNKKFFYGSDKSQNCTSNDSNTTIKPMFNTNQCYNAPNSNLLLKLCNPSSEVQANTRTNPTNLNRMPSLNNSYSAFDLSQAPSFYYFNSAPPNTSIQIPIYFPAANLTQYDNKMKRSTTDYSFFNLEAKMSSLDLNQDRSSKNLKLSKIISYDYLKKLNQDLTEDLNLLKTKYFNDGSIKLNEKFKKNIFDCNKCKNTFKHSEKTPKLSTSTNSSNASIENLTNSNEDSFDFSNTDEFWEDDFILNSNLIGEDLF